jgi:steroid delta-isomerase-like uncharacterized protein
MAKEDNIAAQEKLGEGLNDGNLDIIDEVFAEEVKDHDPAPDQRPGPEGFKDFFTALSTAFPDAELSVETMVADDENVAIAYTLKGTHEGTFHGVEPTGKRIEARGMQIGRFEDGKIVERWGSTDELGILSQLGVAP